MTEKATVLAVDDAPANLAVIRGILGDEFILKLATSGLKALEIAVVEPPDLILLDVMMPEMDGYELCRRLRADLRTSTIPIIFVTARTSLQDEIAGFEAGGSDFIRKPLVPQILLYRMRSLLAARANAPHPAFRPVTVFQGANAPDPAPGRSPTPHIEYHIDLDGFITFSRILAPLPAICRQLDHYLDCLTDLLGCDQVGALTTACSDHGRVEAIVRFPAQCPGYNGGLDTVNARCIMEVAPSRQGFVCQLFFDGENP
jgi:CheY-like chemotaxis protein